MESSEQDRKLNNLSLTPPEPGPIPFWDKHNYVLLIETNPFPKLVVIFLDYALWTSLGTFSILLNMIKIEILNVFQSN